MRVDNINANKNYNTVNSKGYLDRSVINYFENAQTSVKNRMLKSSLRENDVKNFRELSEVMLTAIIELQSIVEPLHPQTALNIGSEYGYDFFYFENSKTNSQIKSVTDERLAVPVINEKSLPGELFYLLGRISKWISSVKEKPLDVDSMLFNRMILDMDEEAKDLSFLGGLKNWLNSRKADKLAPEFGEKSNYTNRFAEIREYARAKFEEEKKKRQVLNEISEEFKNKINL